MQEKDRVEYSIEEAVFQSEIYQNLNDTKAEYKTDVTVNELFEAVARRSGDNTAVICKGESITYSELNHRSDVLANQMRQRGISRGDLVGIMTGRTIDLFVSILGVLKAGAGYVPIDSNYPKDRLQYILKESNIRVLLINDNSLKCSGEIESINISEEIDYSADASVEKVNGPEDIAYVIFTSGSTGNPKGVAIQHEAVVNFILGIGSVISMSDQTKVINATTDSFDIFVYESLAPLLSGATVLLADEEEQRNVKQLTKLMEQYSADVFQSTPSKMSLILLDEESAKRLAFLKSIVIGGEPFPNGMIQKIKQYTDAEIYNFYGPTEATVWATYKNLTLTDDVNIGKPLPNYEVYIIDDDNRLVTSNDVGEIAIAGKGLAKGYLNQDELTNDRFLWYSDENGNKRRLYKTGDLGKITEQGEIQCLGRKDNQIKLNGYRIELGEIENVCLNYPAIKEIVVLCQEQDRKKYLVAYYVGTEEVEVGKIRDFLGKTIPQYMIPQFYVRIDEMPLNTNGKADRLALAAYAVPEVVSAEENLEEDATETERNIAKIWSEVLGSSNFGLNDNFFNIGGNSMMLLTVFSKIDEIYPNTITVLELFDYSTISMIADFIEHGEGKKEYRNRGIGYICEDDSLEGQEMNWQREKELAREEAEALLNLENKLNVATESILIALFHYALYQNGESEEFCLPIRKGNKVLDCLINYEDIEDLNMLIESVDTVVNNVSVLGAVPDAYIGTVKYEKENLYPVCYIDGENDEWCNLFDLVINLKLGQPNKAVQMSCKSRRLSEAQLQELFTAYMELINSLLEN